MTSVVLQQAIALLRASARGQLLVLCASAALLALPALGSGQVDGDTVIRLAVLALVLLTMSTTSIRVALRTERGYETLVTDLPGDVMALIPRLATQCACVLVPFGLAWWCAMAIGSTVDVLGLVLVPLAGLASLLAPPLVMLVIAAVASGDPSWMPVAAQQMAWSKRGAGLAIGWLVLLIVMVVSVPFALIGFIVAAQLPYAGFVAFGAATAVAVPMIGCGSLALWRVLGGTEVVVDIASDRADASLYVQSPVAAPGTELDAWSAGPAWDIAVDAGAAWGTWLRLSTPTQAAIHVTWSGGEAAPSLSLSGADGVWWRPGDPARSGEQVLVDLPAGDTYLQLESRASTAQALSIVLMLPQAVATEHS